MKSNTNNSKPQTTHSASPTILVTGGAGYIGSITVKALIDSGSKVIVVDNLENGYAEAVPKQAKLEIGDVGDREFLDQVFKKYSITAVIDFAAYLIVGESMNEPRKYLINNVLNFINLLDVMLENNCNLIIKSSTASVYGNPSSKEDFPLKESYIENFKPATSALLSGFWHDEELSGDSLYDRIISEYYEKTGCRPEFELDDSDLSKLKIPTSIYGLTKLLDEIILKKYDVQSGLRSISLRYFNVSGAELNGKMGENKKSPSNLMTMAIYAALSKLDSLKVFGNDYDTPDGTGIRDYIHVEDIASGHVGALNYLQEKKKTEIFNLGTGVGYSVLEVIKAVEKASEKSIPLVIEARRSGDLAVSVANPSRANKILDWKAKYSLNDMAKSAWLWHSTHPKGYNGGKEVGR